MFSNESNIGAMLASTWLEKMVGAEESDMTKTLLAAKLAGAAFRADRTDTDAVKTRMVSATTTIVRGRIRIRSIPPSDPEQAMSWSS